MRILNLYRAHPEIKMTQLRVGRLYAEEQKGRLRDKTEKELLVMLDPSNEEQNRLDTIEMGQIRERQKTNG